MTTENNFPTLEETISFGNDDSFMQDISSFLDDAVDAKPVDDSSEDNTIEVDDENEAPSAAQSDESTEEETEEEETQIQSGFTSNTPDQTDEDDEDETPATETENAKAHFDFLTKNGLVIVDDDYEFDGTTEELERLYSESKQKLAAGAFDALWSKLNPDFQEALRYAANGGQSLEDFYKVYKEQPTSISDIDLSDENNQRKVIETYFKKTTKLSDDKIQKAIDVFEKDGDLATEAEDALDYLNQIFAEEREAFQAQQAELNAQREQEQAEYRNNVFQIIDESDQLAGRRKGKIKAFLFNQVERDGVKDTDFNFKLRSVFQSPEHLVQLADIVEAYDPKKGFDLKRFEEKGGTRVANKFQEELDKSLASTQRKLKGTPPGVPKDTVDWESILRQID